MIHPFIWIADNNLSWSWPFSFLHEKDSRIFKYTLCKFKKIFMMLRSCVFMQDFLVSLSLVIWFSIRMFPFLSSIRWNIFRPIEISLLLVHFRKGGIKLLKDVWEKCYLLLLKNLFCWTNPIAFWSFKNHSSLVVIVLIWVFEFLFVKSLCFWKSESNWHGKKRPVKKKNDSWSNGIRALQPQFSTGVIPTINHLEGLPIRPSGGPCKKL